MTGAPGAARGDRGPASPERPAADDVATPPEAGEPLAGAAQESGDDVAAAPRVEGAAEAVILDDVAGLAAQRDEYLHALQRLQADFENYRKRVLRQQEEQSARAAQDLVGKVLGVLDTLDLAKAHLGGEDRAEVSGEARALDQARSQLLDVLAKEGLERVDAAGVEFDPVVHDAVAHAPAEPPTEAAGSNGEAVRTDAETGADPHAVTVDEVLRAGYRWRGQVLRPAMVRVRG